MTAEKTFLQTAVDYIKHYAKATWQRYKKLGIWGKVSSILRSPLWTVLSLDYTFG